MRNIGKNKVKQDGLYTLYREPRIKYVDAKIMDDGDALYK